MRDLGIALRGRTTVIHHVVSHSGRGDFASQYNDLEDRASEAALGPCHAKVRNAQWHYRQQDLGPEPDDPDV